MMDELIIWIIMWHMQASSHTEQSDYVKDFYCVMVEEKALTNYHTQRSREKNHNQTCWCFFVLFYSPSHTSRLFTLFNIYYGLDLDIASIVANQTATFNNSDRSSTLVDLCLLNNLHFFDRQNDPPQLISTFLIIFN